MNSKDRRVVAALIRAGAAEYPNQVIKAYAEDVGTRRVCATGAACIGAGMTFEELLALKKSFKLLDSWNTDAMIDCIREYAPSFDEADIESLIDANDYKQWSFEKIASELEHLASEGE